MFLRPVITRAIQNTSASTIYLPKYIVQIPTGLKREQRFSAWLTEGMEQNAAAIQQVNVKKQGREMESGGGRGAQRPQTAK